MIDIEDRFGSTLARYLTNSLAALPCPSGMVAKDLQLDEKTRDRLRGWTTTVRAGEVLGGSGRGVYLKGPTPARNVAAGAIATTALLLAPQIRELSPIAIPFRTMTSTRYLEAVRKSFDHDDASVDLVDACRGSLPGDGGRWQNVRLLVLMDLGREPRNSVSDFPREELRALLNLRLERGLPTIITSRLTSPELKELYGDDFGEVLVEGFVPIEITEEATANV